MSEQSPDNGQRIIPYLAYADAPAALEFLCKSFGFAERERHPMPDGRIGHAVLEYQGNLLMLASSYPELGLLSPQDLPGVHAQIHCYVSDLDAHYQRARAAGAIVIGEPEEHHGERMYRAVDPEGHRWMFCANPKSQGLPDES